MSDFYISRIVAFLCRFAHVDKQNLSHSHGSFPETIEVKAVSSFRPGSCLRYRVGQTSPRSYLGITGSGSYIGVLVRASAQTTLMLGHVSSFWSLEFGSFVVLKGVDPPMRQPADPGIEFRQAKREDVWFSRPEVAFNGARIERCDLCWGTCVPFF